MAELKRLVFTVTTDLSYDQRMQRICSSLAHAGYQVLIVGRKKRNSPPLTQISYKQHRLRCLFQKGKLFYLEYQFRLFFFLLNRPADIYVGIDLDTLLPTYLIAKLKGKACVYDAHEYFPELPEVIGRPLVRSLWQMLENFLLPRVDGIYTVSPGIKDILEQRYKVQVAVIRNIPEKVPLLEAKPDRPYILYQGALNKGRGLAQLFQVMPQLDIPLWLAGEGDLSLTLRAMAKDMGIEQKVRFMGNLKPEELQVVTAGAWLGINLLEDMGKSYHYSLSNKFFDYMMAAVPGLCINFPEYQKINNVSRIALLVDDLKTDTLLTAIKKLSEDQALYEELRSNCLKARDIFNWEAESERLLGFYKQLLDPEEKAEAAVN